MTDLTTAYASLPRRLRQAEPDAAKPDTVGRPDTLRRFAGVLSWFWLQWRRREIIRVLSRVDDRLLRDAGIEPCDIENFVDTLIARGR